MSVINTNVMSLQAANAMNVNNRNLSKAMQQLSTGSRINSAADDAAGLSITQTMTSEIRGLNQAVRNANDGISLLQVAEGALNAVSDMLQRMRELSVQSANDTNSSLQQGYLDDEYQALGAEIDRILSATTWNGIAVFGGSGGRSADGVFNFQVGAGSDTSLYSISVTISGATSVAALMSAALGSIGSAAAALSAMDRLDTAIDNVSTLRSTLGATINRLTYAADNAANISINTQASRSRILDTDYAATTMEMSRTQIIQQAATAMLAQANQAPASVLSLLK